jgi:putative SOS response-associated peptidase YedK
MLHLHSRASGMPGRNLVVLGFNPFSIVTTDANELMEPVHNRMPVILHPKDYERWLQRRKTASRGPPQPYNSEKMEASPCNPLVGNVRNNGPRMLNSV